MTQPTVKPKRARSPNYPGISLREAITRAGALHEVAQRHPIPAVDAVTTWGYSPTSGAGGVVLGALKKFGLMSDEGSGSARHVRLTPLALRILLDEEHSPQRRQAIKDAALTPPLHAELWKQYGGSLPPDSTLRFMLRREKGFTPNGADEFIRVFRETVRFAELDQSDTVEDEFDDESDEEEGPLMSQAATLDPPHAATSFPRQKDGNAREPSLRLPIFEKAQLIVTWDTPLTPEEWEAMVKLLDAMKPAMATGRPTSDD